MATDFQAIVDAIDAAILAMAAGGGVQTISDESGKSMTYASLKELHAARDRYAALASPSTRQGIRMQTIRFGGTL